jgi:hypothetical protein
VGKIYFNKETGEFWESSFYRRKPPEGYEFTGKEIDHRYSPHCYVVESFYCSVCKCYHPIVLLRRSTIPLHVQKKIEFGEKYGCKIASKLVNYALLLGEKKQHYEFVELLYEARKLDEWMDTIIDLPKKVRGKIIRMVREGRDESEIDLYLISIGLHH